MAHSNGICESCQTAFAYQLINNGFNDSGYAYCEICGCMACLSAWYESIPAAANFKAHGPVTVETESLLRPCSCGGTFRADASPRCPHCNLALSPEVARVYIEANAAGTPKGWKWQGSWRGVYSLIIEGRVAVDAWRAADPA